ncbi:MAG TPA: hypothetical protein VII41_04395 [Steroidobacteraceae bacterium]
MSSPRRMRLLGCSLGLLAALSGCSHPSDSHSAATTSSTGASPVDASSGTQPLRLTKSTYEVTLKPGTTLIDADTMAHAYRGAASDGTLSFDAASAPAVAAIKPGTVAIFAGVAMLQVTAVNVAGGKISVAGTAAGLEDAIKDGHIAWSGALDFNKAVFNPPPGFHRVTDDTRPMLAWENLIAPPAEAALSLPDNKWNGSVKDWDVTIALTPSAGNLHLDIHANKSIGGGTIDVHGVGQFNGLTNQGSITLANGETTEITFNNRGLSGTVDFDWKVAFDADHGGNEPKLKESDVENLPFSLDFPVPVGPIPFKLSFKTGFAFQPAFTSKVAVAQGSYHASFGGDMPMTNTSGADAAGAGTDPAKPPDPAEPPAPAPPAADGGSGALSGSGSINSYGGTLSLAAIGLSTTIALPKITFSIGLPSALDAFLGAPDLGGPYATMLTQANFLATGTLTMVQCEKRELNLLGIVGYKPGLFGKLKLKAVSKTVFEKSYTEIRPPNITLCKS